MNCLSSNERFGESNISGRRVGVRNLKFEIEYDNYLAF
jgi:hypothetical protein